MLYEVITRQYVISDVLDRWYEGAVDSEGGTIDYFKIRTEDGHIFFLRHDRERDVWGVRKQ